MAETKENIEAKLAEYLEGTLDAAGRAEIEQHLRNNPEHRKLMVDLHEAKSVMRSLPRERAPADLTETLQGQLERTALLGDGLGDGAGSLRLNRWPQMFAAAAIVLLAVGLGLVVYIVLPSSHPEGFTVIEREVPTGAGVAAPQADPAPGAVASVPQPRSADRAAETEPAPSEPPIAAKAGPSPADAMAMAEARMTKAGPGDVDRVAGETVDGNEAEAGTLAFAPRDGAAGEEVVLVLASNNLTDAESRVVHLLRSNQLNWERVELPMQDTPVAVGRPGTSLGGMVRGGADLEEAKQQPLQSSREAATPGAAGMDEPATVHARKERAGEGYAAVQGDSLKSNVAAESRLDESTWRDSLPKAEESADVQAAQPRQREDRQSQAGQDGAGQDGAGQDGAGQYRAGQYRAEAQAGQRTQAQQVQQRPMQQQARMAQNQYVVRGLTRQQASALVDSLQQQEATQLAQVYPGQPPGRQILMNATALNEQVIADAYADDAATRPAVAGPQARQTAGAPGFGPATQPVQVGEKLAIEIDELNAPGVEPVTEATVDAQGQIRLQMLGQPLQAEGLDERELEQAIADRYRDADLIPQATVRVRRENAPLTTQPVDQVEETRVDLVIVLQEPLEGPADEMETPTTLPAPTTQAGEVTPGVDEPGALTPGAVTPGADW